MPYRFSLNVQHEICGPYTVSRTDTTGKPYIAGNSLSSFAAAAKTKEQNNRWITFFAK